MKFSLKFDIKSFSICLFMMGLYLVFSKITAIAYLSQISCLVCFLYYNAPLFTSAILFLISAFLTGGAGLILSATIFAFILTLFFGLYRKFNSTPKLETLFIIALASACFIPFGNTLNFIPYEQRAYSSIFNFILTLVMICCFGAIINKGFKFKFNIEELSSVVAIVVAFGLGVSNLISPLVWKALSVFIILFTAYTYKTGISILVSAVLGLSLALFYSNPNFISIYVIFGICAQSFTPLSRHLASVCIVLADIISFLIFPSFIQDYYMHIIASSIGSVLYCFFPTKILKDFKEKLYSFREKQLARESINRNRTLTSNKLYDLASVFAEMGTAFNTFRNNDISVNSEKSHIKKEVLDNVCKKCEYYDACMKNGNINDEQLDNFINIGLAKGKVSLIDMPNKLSLCNHPNNIIYSVNKLLADFRNIKIEKMNTDSLRGLFASQSFGVSEILKSLALETGTILKYQSRLERSLSEVLFQNGFKVSELLIYGEGESITISIIIVGKDISVNLLEKTISKVLNLDMKIYESSLITDDKYYFKLKKTVEFDAIFGVAGKVKDGSTKSGDTYSVTRIYGDKILIAISDGMGTGEKANEISSASLSLIESFYKAGLSGDLILTTVNKLLAINTEETFTALDISVVDLKTCTADFIKYGSPYGFIIGKLGIRIISSSTLPLGIIDELKPSICHTHLEEDDMLLFISDGVADAFGSSSEIVDYLKGVNALNPQTLVDDLLKKAKDNSLDKHSDDMTAVAVRIFKRKIA